MRTKTVEVLVGLFLMAGLVALLALAFKVSGVTNWTGGNYYVLKANFDNIGGLKEGAPVRVSGVTVGHVEQIYLDPQTFRADVIMQIDGDVANFPADTSASIFTEGLLGANYINLSPGFDKNTLKAGEVIQTSHSAIILENLIGQLLFSLKGGDKKENVQ